MFGLRKWENGGEKQELALLLKVCDAKLNIHGPGSGIQGRGQGGVQIQESVILISGYLQPWEWVHLLGGECPLTSRPLPACPFSLCLASSWPPVDGFLSLLGWIRCLCGGLRPQAKVLSSLEASEADWLVDKASQ